MMEGMAMIIELNGEPREIEPYMTVAKLIDHLKLGGRAVAVEINQQIVPRREHEQKVIKDGDVVEIVTLVGGG